MDKSVQAYIDAIAPENRPLFERLHGLILSVQPQASVVLSYGIPTYKFGRKKLHLGAWKHGISLYGWQRGGDAGFVERHPTLFKPKATIQLRPADADEIGDAELVALVRATLGQGLSEKGEELDAGGRG